MSAIELLVLAAVGLASGFVAGLVGIGGGVLIVPFLYFFYGHPEWSGFAFRESLHVTVAHATSLLIIVPTALRGTLSYMKSDLIVWKVAVPVAIAAVAGGVLGARLAITIHPALLKLLFGCFLMAFAVQLFFRKQREVHGEVRTNLFATTVTGLGVGVLSGLMGVGGGIPALPLLMYVLHVDLRRAASTSLVIVGAAALASVTTYALSGLQAEGMPRGSLGYVHVYAAVPIMIGSVVAVHWGTRANQTLNTRALKLVFAVFFLLMGLKFSIENLGVLL
jgi:uncharacterized membrane protein YfcA